jgi:hypothetical protein
VARPGGILALDLSLSTGWAYGQLGEKPNWGRWSLGRVAEGGAVFARLEDEIDDAIRLHRPRALIYEAPLPANRQNDNTTAKLLLGLPAVVELIAYRHRIECFWQNAIQARSKVLGKAPRGKSQDIKPVIMAWAKARGWDTHGQDDAADALLLLVYATVIRDRTGQAHYFKQGAEL